MSDTPRTNRYIGKANDYPQSDVVPASFSRVLERENAALREKLVELSKAYSLLEMLLETDDEYICVDRERGLYRSRKLVKQAAIDAARKEAK